MDAYLLQQGLVGRAQGSLGDHDLGYHLLRYWSGALPVPIRRSYQRLENA